MRHYGLAAALIGAGLFAATSALAQGAPPPYGAAVNLATAKKAAAAAEAYATGKGWKMAIVIVEPSGDLVYFEKMDDTQYGSIKVATTKATSAAMFRRPTQVFHDLLAKGSEFTYLLQLEGANSVPGGFPIVAGGKIVGGIGCSGGTGAQDSETCKAGLDGLK